MIKEAIEKVLGNLLDAFSVKYPNQKKETIVASIEKIKKEYHASGRVQMARIEVCRDFLGKIAVERLFISHWRLIRARSCGRNSSSMTCALNLAKTASNFWHMKCVFNWLNTGLIKLSVTETKTLGNLFKSTLKNQPGNCLSIQELSQWPWVMQGQSSQWTIACLRPIRKSTSMIYGPRLSIREFGRFFDE